MLKTLVLALSVIVLVPKKPTKPELNIKNDGTHVLVNPLKYPVRVSLDCGMEFETTVLAIPSESTMEVKFYEPVTLGEAPRQARCWISSFNKL